MDRKDFRSYQPADVYGQPGIQYPSPIWTDLVIVEDIPINSRDYDTLLPGMPRPNDPEMILVWQSPVKGGPHEKHVRRIYSNGREAQDAYNLALQYVSESQTHPIFIRTYLERRETYTRRTDLTPLQTVTTVYLTNGGTGYTSVPDVSISGGGGTGADVTVRIMDGKVAAIMLTQGGSGYTSDPTVNITGGGGAGATAIAKVQRQDALLIKEEAQPAPGEMASLYLQVTRVYMTLPGPILTAYPFDDRLEMSVKVTKQIVAANTVNPPENVPPSTASAQCEVVEFREIDDNISLKITSYFPSEDELAMINKEYPVVVQHSFPNMLVSADFPWIYVQSGDGLQYDFDVGLRTNIVEGYNGPCNGFMREYFTYDWEAKIASLPASERSIFQMFPEADTIWAAHYRFSASTAQGRLQTFHVPETIHDALTINFLGTLPTPAGGFTYDSDGTASLGATVPSLTEFKSRAEICKDLQVQPHRGFIYCVRTIVIENPHYDP